MAHTFTDSPAGGERVTSSMRPTHNPYKLTPKPYFVLMHNPLGWECGRVGDRWVWLPRLKELQYQPGSNGVRQGRRGGAPDATLAIASFQGKGWTIIPEDYDGGYVVRYTVEGGGYAHLLRFDEPRNIGNRTSLRTDEEAYNAWRLQLVEDGILAPPEPEVIEELLERQRTRITRAERDIHIPAVAKRLEQETSKLDEMEAIA